MTPDEVVARARELEGREVLLTVRGRIRQDIAISRAIFLQCDNARLYISIQDIPATHLVDIQPAPMRIVAGDLYRDASGGLIFEGDDHGMLLRPGRSDTFSPASFPGLQRVKVVPA